MNDCILNLDNLGVESRDTKVLFASKDFIIYKERFTIYLADCDNNVLSRYACPSDDQRFDVVEFTNDILFLFAGKDFIVFDKLGNAPFGHNLPLQKTGRVVTKLMQTDSEDNIVFGTFLRGNLQFLNYDFTGNKRISQTSSWQMTHIIDCAVDSKKIYGLLDSTFLVCCSVDTGETLWTRFETQKIDKIILPYRNGLLYNCQNNLKFADESGNIDNTSIPLVSISQLSHIIDHDLYFLSNENKNIGCYDLQDKALKWEIPGKQPIYETLLSKGTSNKKIYDVLLYRTNDGIGIINLTLGQSAFFLSLTGSQRIRKTSDHILISRVGNRTEMIPG